jgi:hypothetical protein
MDGLDVVEPIKIPAEIVRATLYRSKSDEFLLRSLSYKLESANESDPVKAAELIGLAEAAEREHLKLKSEIRASNPD